MIDIYNILESVGVLIHRFIDFFLLNAIQHLVEPLHSLTLGCTPSHIKFVADRCNPGLYYTHIWRFWWAQYVSHTMIIHILEVFFGYMGRIPILLEYIFTTAF